MSSFSIVQLESTGNIHWIISLRAYSVSKPIRYRTRASLWSIIWRSSSRSASRTYFSLWFVRLWRAHRIGCGLSSSMRSDFASIGQLFGAKRLFIFTDGCDELHQQDGQSSVSSSPWACGETPWFHSNDGRSWEGGERWREDNATHREKPRTRNCSQKK